MDKSIDFRATAALSVLRIWLNHHLNCAATSFVRVWRSPGAALLTISAMALTMSLPLGLWLALGNLEHLSGSIERSQQIDVFLTPDIEPEHAQQLAQQLRHWPAVMDVTHQSPDQGLAELRTRQGWSEISELLSDDNPLPHRLRVTPAAEDDTATLATALAALAEVDMIQYDAQWLQRLEDWLRLGRRLVWVLAGLFGLGTVLVVGNSVRLDLQGRREEMNVLALLGASHGFIQRPFLYLGAWYGLLAGLLAIGVLLGVVASLHAPLAALISSYGSRFTWQHLTWLEGFVILAGSAGLGSLGAAMVSAVALRQFRS